MRTLMISTVSAFFRQRAGMFFVVLGVLFGFLSGREHHAFAVFFLTGSFGMWYLFGIWLLYALICVQFLMQVWKLPEYTFIYHCRMWPGFKRLIRFTILGLGFLQPILFYGIYLISIAIQDQVTDRVWPIFIFYLILTCVIAAAAEWRIRKPVLYVARNSSPLIVLPFKRPGSWIYWTMEWLFRERGITMLMGKLGAILVSVGTMLYYSTDQYDIRLPAVGLSFAYMLNLGISYEFFKWETNIWLWGRSLPFSQRNRFFKMLSSSSSLKPWRLCAMLPSLFSRCFSSMLWAFRFWFYHTFFYIKKKVCKMIPCRPSCLASSASRC
jgi:hypothetical protein